MKDKLGNHIQQVRGVSYKPNDLSVTLSDGYITLLRANNISEGKINFDSVQFVSSSKVSSEQILKTNDILVCSSSGSLSLVGKSALYKKTGEHTFGAFCKVVRATGKLLPQYIAFYMCSQAYRRHIENIANGANINNLRNEHLDDILLPIPSETKQNAIITKLEKMESVISQRRTQLAKLDELVKCRFVEMLNHHSCSNVPLSSLLKDSFWLMPATPDFVEQAGNIPYITSKNIRNREIDFENVKHISHCDFERISQNRTICKNDILVSMIGTLGQIAVVNQSFDFYGQNLYLLRLNNEVVNTTYFCEAFCSDKMQFDLLRQRNQSTQAYLKANHILDLHLPYVNRDMQNHFASFVRRIDKLRFK